MLFRKKMLSLHRTSGRAIRMSPPRILKLTALKDLGLSMNWTTASFFCWSNALSCIIEVTTSSSNPINREWPYGGSSPITVNSPEKAASKGILKPIQI